jgi:hypothetical protein
MKIKATTVYRINLLGPEKPEDKDTKRIPHTVSEFDKNGQLVQEVRYTEDGEIDEKNVNVYDESGKLKESMTYLDEEAPAEHKSYERDEEGQVIKAFKHYQDGEKDTIHYNRDAQGRVTEKITIDSFNEEEARETIEYEGENIAHRVITEYDEKTLDESFEYDEKGKLAKHTKWTINEEDATYASTFNEDGNLMQVMKYNEKGKLLSRVVYHYEAKRPVKIVEETPYGTNTSHIKYDEKGNPAEQFEENDAGEMNHKVLKKFNDQGDVIESEILIRRHGNGPDQHYKLYYEYQYYEE